MIFRFITLFMLGVSLNFAQAAQSNSGTGQGLLGAGVMFGEPTGLTAKYWLSSATAVQFGLAYSFGDYFEILVDHLWHFPNVGPSISDGKISSEFVPYMGVGGALFADTRSSSSASRSSHFFRDSTSDSSVALGIRIPFGIEYLPRKLPLGVFLELVPGVGIVPKVFAFLQADLGIRYYF
jgi:hypothetical protein